MESGTEGEDKDLGNPLARALRKLFEDGQPFTRLIQCFCVDHRKEINNPMLRWLGVFVLSAGGRILFFPGFQSSNQYVEGFHKHAQMWKKNFNLDHLSLEKDLRRWHITSSELKGHLGGPLTAELGPNQYLWCGLSINSLDELRIVKRETSVTAQVPESDARRRFEVFRKSRENAKFQILDWHDHIWEKDLNNDVFWHFSFVVSSSQSPIYTGDILGFPKDSPFLAVPLPERLVQMPVRHHRIELSEETVLQITTAVVPGKLKVPASLTAMEKLNPLT